MGVTEQAVNVVRTVRAALVLIAALLAVMALVMMHAAVVDASATPGALTPSSAVHVGGIADAQPSGIEHAAVHSDVIPHGSDFPNVELCPCPGDSGSSMTTAECTPVAALTGLVVIASLRAECVGFEPTEPVALPHAGTLVHAQTPSLHVLSISRT
ncbi:hypothetical protein A20C1_11531 [marine actinobacterium PHSC20C1]|nr:hypothetical protein A20C1_11531 [marine actinobacterium PHSC20C1]